MRFRVKGGNHVEGTGDSLKTYQKGDVIETDVDLSKKFKDKFERVFEEEKPKASKFAKKEGDKE